jgi:hypothetical protein
MRQARQQPVSSFSASGHFRQRPATSGPQLSGRKQTARPLLPSGLSALPVTPDGSPSTAGGTFFCAMRNAP